MAEQVKIQLTKAEQKWIEQLRKVLDKAPKTLSLFGNAGTLQVWKYAPYKHKGDYRGLDKIGCSVADGFKVKCDGGDPVDGEDVINFPEIEYM